MSLTTAAGERLPLLTPEQQLVADYYQHQALLCQWFATLLANELNEEQLQSYLDGQATPLLEALGEQPELATAVARLRQAIATLPLLAQPRLELAADFAGLFLSDARHSPAPYASLYKEGARFNGPPNARMQQYLASMNYEVDKAFSEPADHLAIMLDYLAENYRRLAHAPTPEAEAVVAEFVQQELSDWVGQLAPRANQVDTASDFYPALLALLAAFFS